MQMEQAANANDIQGYLSARSEAEKHAKDDERSWFGRQLTSLESHVESRGELVREKDGFLDERLSEKQPSSNLLYVNPNLSEEEKVKLERIHATAEVLSEPVRSKHAREVEATYSSKNFGREAEFIHPRFKSVDASLVDFEPMNDTHAALVRSMIEAVVDQRYAMRLASGEEESPWEVAFSREYPEDEIIKVNAVDGAAYEDTLFLDKRTPEDEFNHGWLFAFYEGVAEAKWDRYSAAYPSGGVAARATVEKAFVQRQWEKWDAEYRKNPSAFNDGAVTAWDVWREGL